MLCVWRALVCVVTQLLAVSAELFLHTPPPVFLLFRECGTQEKQKLCSIAGHCFSCVTQISAPGVPVWSFCATLTLCKWEHSGCDAISGKPCLVEAWQSRGGVLVCLLPAALVFRVSALLCLSHVSKYRSDLELGEETHEVTGGDRLLWQLWIPTDLNNCLFSHRNVNFTL